MKRHESSRPTSLVELKGLIVNIQVRELESLVASMPMLQSFEQKVPLKDHKILSVIFTVFN